MVVVEKISSSFILMSINYEIKFEICMQPSVPIIIIIMIIIWNQQ